MPCKEGNSPTERIGDLLAEIEELLQYAEDLEGQCDQTALGSIGRRPVLLAFEKEKLRRQYTLRTVEATKQAKRRSRIRLEGDHRVRSREETGLSDEVKAQIEQLIEEDAQ